MKIKVTDNGKKPAEWVEFEVEDVPVSIANAIRRIIRAEVPVLAVEDVTFKKNSSALYDEMFALRLGLIPLVTPDSYSYEEGGKEGPENTVILTLKAKGPGWVTASEIKSTDRQVKPAFGDIPIVWLEDKQEIEVEMKARMGVAKVHAKWQPGLAAYSIEGNVYKFYVESYGQLPVKDLVTQAATILANKAKTVEEAAGKL